MLELFWRYLYRSGEIPSKDIEAFSHDLGELAEQTRMTTAQRIIEEAAPKIREEGRTEGRAASLKRLISLKFGNVDASVTARIDAGTSEQLDRWTDRILTAESLDELFAD